MELNPLTRRMEGIHDLAKVMTRRVKQMSPEKIKTKDHEKILMNLPEELLSVDLKEKGKNTPFN